MKAVNDGQEISNRLTIIILVNKKCLSENHLSDTPLDKIARRPKSFLRGPIGS